MYLPLFLFATLGDFFFINNDTFPVSVSCLYKLTHFLGLQDLQSVLYLNIY